MKQKESFSEFGQKCKCKEKFIIPNNDKNIRKKKLLRNNNYYPILKKKIPVNVTLHPTPMKSKIVYSINSKTFYVECAKKLSSIDIMMLKSFEDKYIYYAIDDILSFFKSKPVERETMLSLLYSPIISLQNTFSVDFFDIWIKKIYSTQTSKINKFFANTNQNLEPVTSLSIILGYKLKLPAKKRESLW
jgi:hypothetical protein